MFRKKIYFHIFMMILIILFFVAIGFLLPETWRASTSVVLKATPEEIYPLISNFKDGWSQWSQKSDEHFDEVIQYTPPFFGVGATRFWGPSDHHFAQTITKNDPLKRIHYTTDVTEFFIHVHGEGEIELTPIDAQTTRVRWVVSGHCGDKILRRYAFLYIHEVLSSIHQKSLLDLEHVIHKQRI